MLCVWANSCIGYLMRNDASPNLCNTITVRHISANIKFKSTYICCAHVVQTHSKNLCGTKKQYDLLFLQLFLLKLSVIKGRVYIQSSILQIPFVLFYGNVSCKENWLLFNRVWKMHCCTIRNHRLAVCLKFLPCFLALYSHNTKKKECRVPRTFIIHKNGEIEE